VAHHGYLHEPPNEQSPEREWELLGKGVEIIKRFTGAAPRGWRAPYGAYSDRSGSYLAKAGFLYDSSLSNDHDPFLLRTDNGTILELPIDITMSDAPHYSHVPQMGYPMSPKPPQEAVAYFMSTFDAAYRIGGFATTIWHPEISGRPSRLLAWVDMVRDLQERGDIWIAPLRDIAEHVLKLSEAGEVTLREVRVPFYTGPISELERP
jgi:peptidoglycan/xylan/chitin deacetylase (PgdA/CDA1 family)